MTRSVAGCSSFAMPLALAHLLPHLTRNAAVYEAFHELLAVPAH